jgi:hypothetical protein
MWSGEGVRRDCSPNQVFALWLGLRRGPCLTSFMVTPGAVLVPRRTSTIDLQWWHIHRVAGGAEQQIYSKEGLTGQTLASDER